MGHSVLQGMVREAMQSFYSNIQRLAPALHAVGYSVIHPLI